MSRHLTGRSEQQCGYLGQRTFQGADPQCKGPEVRACPERPTSPVGMSREEGMQEVKDEKQEVRSEKEWGLDHIKPSRTVVFNGNSSLSLMAVLHVWRHFWFLPWQGWGGCWR